MSKNGSKTQEVMLFAEGKENFCLPTARVKEILNLKPVQTVPFAAPYLLGVIHLKGQVVPLLSVAKILLPTKPFSRLDYGILMEIDGMPIALNCGRIIGIKNASKPVFKRQDFSVKTKIEEYAVKWLDVRNLVSFAADHLMGRIEVSP